jgi:cation:H+ antiporter
MSVFLDSILLLVLFAALGAAADFTVRSIKLIAAELKIRLFAFGILLGLFTSLPELFVGIQATLNGANSLAAGNLLGGISVMLGLILGASLLLSREISTDGSLRILIPEILVISLPLLLGADGSFGTIDGILMIGAYLGLIYHLYRENHSFGQTQPESIQRNVLVRAILLSIAGAVGILLASHWIVEIAQDLLGYIRISELAMGILIFSLGTNLPEISIAFTSWRKKASSLSLSHLLSSAFTNVLVLGALAFMKRIDFNVGPSYLTMAAFTAIILILFSIFHQSKKKLDFREGFVLLAVYVIFVITNFIFLGQ